MQKQTDLTSQNTKSGALAPTHRPHLGPHRWQKGQSGNPAGRPKGARSQLPELFLSKLYDSFKLKGDAAIERMIEDKPNEYVRVIASLLPKELLVKQANTLDGMSDAELTALIERMHSQLKIVEHSPLDGQHTEHNDQSTDVPYTDSLIDELMGE